MKHHPIQRYKSITDLIISHDNLILPRPHAAWRLLVQPCVGSLNGLEKTFSGIAIATNGIIVAIETSAGVILFGHLQWFNKDDLNMETDLDIALAEAKGVSMSKQSKQKVMSKLCQTFEECF